MIDDCIHIPITQQMKQLGEKEPTRFMDAASKGKNDENNNIINDENLWPERTQCIMGDSIINGLDELSIKSFIESELPTCKINISTPTYRNDNAKCGLTIKHLCDHIKLNLGIVDNTNICGVHLGKRRLHMNGK